MYSHFISPFETTIQMMIFLFQLGKTSGFNFSFQERLTHGYLKLSPKRAAVQQMFVKINLMKTYLFIRDLLLALLEG